MAIEPIGTVSLRFTQAMQAGRETSALLSTLPGPNMSFFQPPAPPGIAGQGLTPRGASFLGRPPSIPLLETMQAGRETSTLLSSLMGPGQRAFPAPVPPRFAPAGVTNGPGAAATGAGAGNALPRAAAPLLETEQQSRTTSTLRSVLMGPQGTNLQAVDTAAPSADNRRIANEAYQMETRAQSDWANQRAAGGSWTREWFG